jgi:hypothetical protein
MGQDGEHRPVGDREQQAVPESEGHHEEIPESVFHAFVIRGRALLSLERRLRLVTGVALAQLIAGAIIVTTRDLPLPLIGIQAVEGRLVSMAAPTFVLCIIFICISWAYLLSGILHAHPLLRLLGLVAFSVAMFPVTFQSVLRPLFGFTAVLLVAAVWAVGLFTIFLDRRRPPTHEKHLLRRLHYPTFLIVLVLVLLVYLNSLLSSTTGGSTLLFSISISLQLQFLQFFLVPILFLAGTDFAEWGEASAERVTTLAKQRRLLLAVVAVLVAVAVIVDGVRQQREKLPPQLLFSALAVALVLGLGRLAAVHRRRWRAHLPYVALASGAVVYVTLFLIGAVITIVVFPQKSTAEESVTAGGLLLTRYTSDTEPKFSMLRPSLWETVRLPDGLEFDGSKAANPSRFYVLSRDGTGADVAPARLRELYPDAAVEVSPAQPDGDWQRSEAVIRPTRGAEQTAYLWQRSDQQRTWMLAGVTPSSLAPLNRIAFDRMRESWTDHPEAVKPKSSDSTPIVVGSVLAWFVILALTAVLLYNRARRPRPGQMVAGLLFIGTVGALFIVEGLNLLSNALHGPAWLANAHATQPGLQMVVALSIVGVVVWLAVSRRLLRRREPLLELLLVLLLGMEVLNWIFDLYSGTTEIGGRFTLAQAVVILLALTWDIVMTGGAITTVGGRWFPRHSRVLIYFGYVMLVSAAVLYFSSFRAQATGTSVEPQFESDFWIQAGLLALGIPMLFTLFLLKLSGWLASEAPGGTPADVPGLRAPG